MVSTQEKRQVNKQASKQANDQAELDKLERSYRTMLEAITLNVVTARDDATIT